MSPSESVFVHKCAADLKQRPSCNTFLFLCKLLGSFSFFPYLPFVGFIGFCLFLIFCLYFFGSGAPQQFGYLWATVSANVLLFWRQLHIRSRSCPSANRNYFCSWLDIIASALLVDVCCLLFAYYEAKNPPVQDLCKPPSPSFQPVSFGVAPCLSPGSV